MGIVIIPLSVLILSLCMRISSALLSLPHLSESFYLLPATAQGETFHPSCGCNFGKDPHTVGLTRAYRISGNLKVPVSPIHYFYDGERCIETRTAQNDVSSFLLHESVPTRGNPIKTGMKGLVKSLRTKIGERDIISVHGVHMSEEGNTNVTTIQCGSHRLKEMIFVRPSFNTTVIDDDGKKYVLTKQIMYAFTKEKGSERICFHEGYSRAPPHAIGFGYSPSGYPQFNNGSRDRKIAFAVSIIGVLCLAVFLYSSTFILYRETKKSEDTKKGLNVV